VSYVPSTLGVDDTHSFPPFPNGKCQPSTQTQCLYKKKKKKKNELEAQMAGFTMSITAAV